MRRLIPLALAVGVAACGGASERYGAPLAPAGDRIGIRVSSVEVRQITLPNYALDEQIRVETAEGALVELGDALWAAEPAAGTTQELARQLGAVTGARVAAEPWPFDSLPQAVIDLRVDRFVAGADGRFHISGQYFVVSDTGGRDRAAVFDVSAPIAPESGAPGIARARAAAVRDLARTIASEGL